MGSGVKEWMEFLGVVGGGVGLGYLEDEHDPSNMYCNTKIYMTAKYE